MNGDGRLNPQTLYRLMRPMLIGGIVCLILLALGMIVRPTRGDGVDQFFSAWLFAWLFWLGVSLGSMAIIMMQHLTGGTWGLLVRRFGETAALCTPLLLILFIPILFGLKHLYPWAIPARVHADAVLAHKAAWLNAPAWIARSFGYLFVFWLLAWFMRSTSLAHDRTSAVSLMGRLRSVSAAGLVIYFVLMSLASVDWIMSREPHWVSTIFGFVVCIAQSISACCFFILLLAVFENEEPLKGAIQPNYLNDLASVLITFVILWAYMSFAQFLITWLGNSQDEITWYIARTDGGWRWVGAGLIAFHFFVPFILLLQRPLKRKLGRLAAIAGGLLFMRAVDGVYWIAPSAIHAHPDWGAFMWLYAQAMNLVAFLGIGALWFVTFLWLLKGQPIMVVGDRVPVIAVDHGHGQRPTPGAV
jgi:hypothetical protein